MPLPLIVKAGAIGCKALAKKATAHGLKYCGRHAVSAVGKKHEEINREREKVR